ncbi:ATPase, T2SS/T4P/T4SS family [Thiotrichales bacterium HSG1]|nr:ATPase, T2SS/T4P/T4SS family [Thiotrichales bacterium HSG1]
MAKKIDLVGILQKLVENRALSRTDAKLAFVHSRKQKTSLVTYLMKNRENFIKPNTNNAINSYDIALALFEKLEIPFADIDSFILEKEVVTIVDWQTIKTHHVIPLFKRGNVLFIAVSDPTNLEVLEQIKAVTKMHIEKVLVEDDKLLKIIEKNVEEIFTEQFNDNLGCDDMEFEFEDIEPIEEDYVEPSPIHRFVDKMIFDAIKMGASDLHFEPYEKYYQVRFRIDGILQVVAEPPVRLAHKLAGRILQIAKLNISKRHIPQKGRFDIKVSSNSSIAFRVSICPTIFGEKIVIRVINSSFNIDTLGYEKYQKSLYLDALANPYGMILVTGPAGSGKSVTIYTGINYLNKKKVDISTIEEPVEIILPGVNQVQVEEKLTFAEALKGLLWQEPDVIFIGEIWNLETANLAIKAATSGHLVISTMQTIDTTSQTLINMIDIGIPSSIVATTVNLIQAQRLCRRLCNDCKVEMDITEHALLNEGFSAYDIPELEIYQSWKGNCINCNNNGYKGRIGIYQVMPISNNIADLIIDGSDAIEITKQMCSENIIDLHQSGLKKVKNGVTSLEEINRIVRN